MDIRHGRVVLGHADIVEREESVPALEAFEIRVHQRAGDFSGAVGAEVEEDDRIVCLYARAFGADHRNDEFVGDVLAFLVAIMCAYKKEGCDERDFAGAARREALRMKDDINSVL